jgi:hypothetical protein
MPVPSFERRLNPTRRQLLQTLGAVSAGAALVPLLPATPAADAASAPRGADLSDLTFAENDRLPFSFVYDGRPSSALLSSWQRTESKPHVDTTRRTARRTITWTEPTRHGARLQVQCNVVEYLDYRGTTEWTLGFKNTGNADSAQLQQVLAIDLWVRRESTQQYLVHTNGGSADRASDFAPNSYLVEPNNSARTFFSEDGWPTSGVLNSNSAADVVGGGWPYYNIDLGDGTGYVMALGWPGQWGVQMRREATDYDMHILGAMSSHDTATWGSGNLETDALLDTYLHPREEIRTPLVVWQPWAAEDWIAAQNTWRSWMLAHNTPLHNGKPLAPISATGIVCGYFPGLRDSESDELAFMDAYIAHRTLAGEGGVSTHWWMDAGWYDTRVDGTGAERDWSQVGTWEPSPIRFPNGLAPVTAKAHAHGLDAIVWHEPERISRGSWLADNHPEWLIDLGPTQGNLALDLGNPEAWRWAVDHFSALLTEGKIQVLRTDHNFAPLPWWNRVDDRARGIVDDGDPRINYVGTWVSDNESGNIENDRHYSQTVGSYSELIFTGASVQWIGEKNNVCGLSDVYLDGGKVATVNQYSPATPPPLRQLLYSSGPLTPGQHTIRVVNVGVGPGAPGPFNSIDAFLVSQSTPTPARIGMTQVKNVTGFLAFWDELRKRHPGLVIDTCAGGGRRLDLETLRRSVPLDRSDYEFEPISQQCQTHGLATWLAYTGTGIYTDTAHAYGDAAYVVRSAFLPALGQVIDTRNAAEADWQFLRAMQTEWSDVAPNMLGDYYPLTGYTMDPGVWMAMQFHRPEHNEGVVLAFRRPANRNDSLALSLRGIDTGTRYEVHDYNAATATAMSGDALANLTVTLNAGQGTTLRYRKTSRG